MGEGTPSQRLVVFTGKSLFYLGLVDSAATFLMWSFADSFLPIEPLALVLMYVGLKLRRSGAGMLAAGLAVSMLHVGVFVIQFMLEGMSMPREGILFYSVVCPWGILNSVCLIVLICRSKRAVFPPDTPW